LFFLKRKKRKDNNNVDTFWQELVISIKRHPGLYLYLKSFSRSRFTHWKFILLEIDGIYVLYLALIALIKTIVYFLTETLEKENYMTVFFCFMWGWVRKNEIILIELYQISSHKQKDNLFEKWQPFWKKPTSLKRHTFLKLKTTFTTFWIVYYLFWKGYAIYKLHKNPLKNKYLSNLNFEQVVLFLIRTGLLSYWLLVISLE